MPKCLRLQIHKPDLFEVSDSVERSFQIGYGVGDVAQGLFPDGILIGDDDDLAAALVSTKVAIASHLKKPIFEATFQHDGLLVRADLLLPTPSGYRMVEVRNHLPASSPTTWTIAPSRAGYSNKTTFRWPPLI